MRRILNNLATSLLKANQTPDGFSEFDDIWVSRKLDKKTEDFAGEFGGISDKHKLAAYLLYNQEIVYTEREARSSCGLTYQGSSLIRLVAFGRNVEADALENRLRESLEIARRNNQTLIKDVANYSNVQIILKKSDYNFIKILAQELDCSKWKGDFAVIAIDFELQFEWNYGCDTPIKCEC